MTAKAETTFANSVHKPLKGRLHVEKMHNPFRGGTWDYWYSGKRDMWIEFKFIELPKRATTIITPELSELQLDWGNKRLAEGRDLAVIVGSKEGGVIFLDGLWRYGKSAAEFRTLLLTRQQLSDWIWRRTGG